jgi:hypothetical protein
MREIELTRAQGHLAQPPRATSPDKIHRGRNYLLGKGSAAACAVKAPP